MSNTAWHKCPAGAHPILVGNLNLDLRAPRTKREETIVAAQFSICGTPSECSLPPPRERLANRWITDKTWKIINKRVLLHWKGTLSQTTARSLGREIKARLKADCLLRTKNTASNIKGYLAAGEFVEAWRQLKGWYCSAEDQTPKPCQDATIPRQPRPRP